MFRASGVVLNGCETRSRNVIESGHSAGPEALAAARLRVEVARLRIASALTGAAGAIPGRIPLAWRWNCRRERVWTSHPRCIAGAHHHPGDRSDRGPVLVLGAIESERP